MALQFYIGASGSGKSFQLHKDLHQLASQHPEQNFFLIVPDQFTMQTQMDMVQEDGNGIMNIDVLSFGRLSHRILEELGADRTLVLDDTGKSLIIRKLAGELGEQLPILGPNLSKLGYVHEVKSAISEFMQYGLLPEQILQQSQNLGTHKMLQGKLQELGLVYSKFLEYLKDDFLTKEETLALVRDNLHRSSLIRGSVIAFDGFTGFTPIQYQVIAQLIALAAEVKVSIILDTKENPYVQDGEQKLFHLSKKTIADLRKLAEGVGAKELEPVLLDMAGARFGDCDDLRHLEQHIFRYPLAPYLAEPAHIHINKASTIHEEIRQTCIRIQRLIREKQYAYRDIAVVTGDLAGYANELGYQFAQFGLPYFMDTTRGLLLNPFIEYIRGGLLVVLQDFSMESILHYLRSGLTGASMEQVDKLENFLRKSGVRGRKKWEQPFTVALRGKDDSSEDQSKDAEFEEINALREQILKSLSPLLQSGSRVKEYIWHLYDFMVQGESWQKLQEQAEYFVSIEDLGRAKEYKQIYHRVADLMDQIMSLIGEEEMPLQEFADILDAGFGEIQIGIIPPEVDRILIGDMERTRLKQVKILFFLGVNDGNVPKATGKGGLISDIDREYLLSEDWDLSPTPRQQIYIQRLYLYMNMTKPSDALYLSYAQVDGNGHSLQPSYLIATLKELFPAMEIDVTELEDSFEQLECAADIENFYAQKLREYSVRNLQESDLPRLYGVHHFLEQTDKGKKLLQTAFEVYQSKPLAKAVAELLYGSCLKGSVSRLELYAACAYAHYLSYGIGLEEREEKEFRVSDLGTLYHAVLEAFPQVLKQENLEWETLDEIQIDRIVGQLLDREIATKYAILYENARNKQQIDRISRVLKRSVSTLKQQICQGSFVPERFELGFERIHKLEQLDLGLTGTERMRIRGRIDRMDTCVDEEHVYVKVIDYKSGKKSFDLAAVYYGLQLQLVVYLNAAMEVQRKNYPDKEIVPAAMLYYRVTDPLVEVEAETDADSINQKVKEALKMTGLVNRDEEVIRLLDHNFDKKSDIIPVSKKANGEFSSDTMPEESLRLVSKYTEHKMQEIGSQILLGDIAVNPFVDKNIDACGYCSFRSICQFDSGFPGYEGRTQRCTDAAIILCNMEEELKRG